ncbi:MAG: hypothetical protein N3A69_08980 [Leptospiraceae bacterium]|nr:hypothetical protein [Leptospiraceae bacterium]
MRKKGLTSLNQNDFAKAIFYFQKVLEQSPLDAFANYNLACTYGVLLSKDYCAHQKELPKLYTHLERAVSLNPHYKLKMLSDKDFSAVQKEVRFYKIAGFNLNKEDDLKIVLKKVAWYAKSEGVFGPQSGLIFKDKNQFQYWRLEFQNSEEPTKKFYNGTYLIEGKKILLTFQSLPKNLKRKSFTAIFKEDKLILDGLGKEYTDDPEPCSI